MKEQLRYDEREMSLIKNTFGNLDLLKALRKVFLQMPLPVLDQSLLKMNVKKDTLAIIRKVFLPTLEPDAPLHNEIDLWMTIKIDDKLPDDAMAHIYARKKVIDYLEQQLLVLEKNKKEEIKFDDFIKLPKDGVFTSYEALEVYSSIFARNTLIFHIEQQLMQLYLLATQKELSEDDKKKDSVK
jgi:hypothetical protein